MTRFFAVLVLGLAGCAGPTSDVIRDSAYAQRPEPAMEVNAFTVPDIFETARDVISTHGITGHSVIEQDYMRINDVEETVTLLPRDGVFFDARDARIEALISLIQDTTNRACLNFN